MTFYAYLTSKFQRGMNEGEFAKKLGVPQSTLRSWRVPGTCPKVKQLNIVAEHLHISISELTEFFKEKGAS